MQGPFFTPDYQKLPRSIQNWIKKMIEVLKPEQVILFGSRARGDCRENSDFDIAVKLAGASSQQLARFHALLEEELITLYPVDWVDWSQLDSVYQKNILNEGKLLYEYNHAVL